MLRALKARYVFPVAEPPIADGAVVIDGERFVGVVRANRLAANVEVDDLGNVAIIPGLVNVHTHLEFSDLPQPLGTPGMLFPEWIRAVIMHRRASPTSEASRAAAVALGVAESLRAGTTTIGEIATAGFPPAPLDEAQLGGVLFLESLGLSPQAVDAGFERSHVHTLTSRPKTGKFVHGVSPHAPYSTHWDLFLCLREIAKEKQVPIAMHLAESREELELLRTHGGPFRKMLDDLGVWNAEAIPLNKAPLDYLRLLVTVWRGLIIHGNYLDLQEIAFAGRFRASVVYCPRTHAYFKHESYPLTKMLTAGVNVALGTDSRASNPDLSLVAEMRHVARYHDVPRDEVLRMGTLRGARALGFDHEVGSIEPGKRADFAVVALPDRDARDPHELLFDSDLSNVATYCGGVKVA